MRQRNMVIAYHENRKGHKSFMNFVFFATFVTYNI